MSHTVIIKPTERKVDPKDARTSPNHEKALAVGQANMKQWEAEGRFESEGQRQDYLKEVAKNPHNVPGLPVFFPALQIRSAMNSKNVKYCVKCDEPIPTSDAMCQNCGYVVERCPHCKNVLYERKDDSGIIRCFYCVQPIGVKP